MKTDENMLLREICINPVGNNVFHYENFLRDSKTWLNSLLLKMKLWYI